MTVHGWKKWQEPKFVPGPITREKASRRKFTLEEVGEDVYFYL
jgi:hypothetical protein